MDDEKVRRHCEQHQKKLPADEHQSGPSRQSFFVESASDSEDGIPESDKSLETVFLACLLSGSNEAMIVATTGHIGLSVVNRE